MKKTLACMVCCELIGLSGEITFEALKASAQQNSHRLALRAIDTRIEQTRLEGVYASLYPQLSLGYNGEYNRNLDPAASGSLMVGDTMINSTVPYKYSAVLRMNYELYRFGATMKQIEAGEAGVSVKGYEACGEEVKLYTELLEHYVRAQRAQNDQMFKSRMRTLRQELYALKQRLHAAGKESRVSVGDEAIRLIDLERDLERARLEFAENVIALSRLSHTDLESSNISLKPLDSSPGTPLSFFNTPQSHAYEEKILQKQAEISALQRMQLPAISLYSSYYLYGSDPHSLYEGFNDIRPNSWNAGLSIRWSLFEGFKYNSESERLSLELDRLREEAELAKREFDYETRTSQENIERLAMLSHNETEALHETRSKLAMTERLRAQGEADAVSEVSVKLEALERELTLESEKIQYAYEGEKLKLQHTEAAACTPR